MDKAFNLRHLLAVADLAEAGGFGRAAARGAITQSALSQAVAKLEAGAGASLFARSAQGAAPTKAGRLLAARLKRAFAWLDEGERALVRRGERRRLALKRAATTAQWRALIAVVESGSYSGAARALGLAQPSVHRAARELEQMCGVRLFLPAPWGVTSSPEARELARCARIAFSEIERGFEEVREHQGVVDGRLAIGCLPFARTHWAPRAVSRLLERYPDAKVRIVDGPYDELLQDLRHGRLDLILGALRAPAPGADVAQEILFEAPLAIVVRAGHPILAKRRPRAADFAALDWVAARAGTPARERFEAFFAAQGVAPPARLVECSSLVATRALLLQSDRAALLSAGQARYEAEAGQLAELAHALPGTERPFGLATRADWRPTAMQGAFLDIVRAVAAEEEGAPRRGRAFAPVA